MLREDLFCLLNKDSDIDFASEEDTTVSLLGPNRKWEQEEGPANHLSSLSPDLLRLVLRDSQPLPVAAHLWVPSGQHVQRQEAHRNATPPLLHLGQRLP